MMMNVYDHRGLCSESQQSEEDTMVDVRKGPWTIEEDSMLIDYVTIHGEGRWNSVARCSGLKRTGKSCRLRWLNYLRPDVRRGNITLQEQLLILELHSRWGNRWSKIAQHLPGRTDNEIKNYWRTRVQKQAKQLKCDVNSKQFRDTMRYVWMPRLVERIQAASNSSSPTQPTSAAPAAAAAAYIDTQTSTTHAQTGLDRVDPSFLPELSGTSSDSQVSSVSELTECYNPPQGLTYTDDLQNGSGIFAGSWCGDFEDATEQRIGEDWLGGGDSLESVWNDGNIDWAAL